MPRFVVLHHVVPAESERSTHFDLMLEADGALLTWELPQSPQQSTDQAARRLPDHRLDYLSIEGPLSENRGTVTRWDAGTYTAEADELKRRPGSIDVRLSGKKLRGRLRLEEVDDEPQRWRFSFSTD